MQSEHSVKSALAAAVILVIKARCLRIRTGEVARKSDTLPSFAKIEKLEMKSS